MALENESYLLNVSVVAMTFTAVSAVIMLLRQSMGGKVSPFDVYLLTAFTSLGFTQTLCAMLPVLVALFAGVSVVVWGVSGLLAAALLGAVVTNIIRQRLKASPTPVSWGVRAAFTLHATAVAIFLLDALPTPLQGEPLYALAVTLSLAAVLWAFVRRIASLFGEQVGEDWDPKLG